MQQRRTLKAASVQSRIKAIPYRACIDARGWVNGRLVCGDDSAEIIPLFDA